MHQPNWGGPLYRSARLLISLIFIVSGVSKIVGLNQSLEYMTSYGLPREELLLLGAAAIELVGGFLLLTGKLTRFAAWGLAFYLIPVTLIFHTNFRDQNQVIQFLKNCAMIGGLLSVAVIERARVYRLQVYDRLPEAPVQPKTGQIPAQTPEPSREPRSA